MFKQESSIKFQNKTLLLFGILGTVFVIALITAMYHKISQSHNTFEGVPEQVTDILRSNTPPPNFKDDRHNKSTGFTLGADFSNRYGTKELPDKQRKPSGCLLGCGPCSPLCSGEGNPCNIIAPVPGPTWQPQSASTVAYRLRTGNYVPAYCKQGTFKLQNAPGCANLENIHDKQLVKNTQCFTSMD